MINVNGLAQYIKRFGERADRNIFNTFESFVRFFEEDLKSKAPVDKGDFKEGWHSETSRGMDQISAQISNDKVYASAIEFGSSPGEKPWPSPGPKTVMSNGRIFSSQAVGGTIEKTFDKENINDFAETIAKSILRAFK